MVDVCGGQPPGVRVSPEPRQAPSAPEERSAMSSQEPVCCDLASGQWPGTWTVSVVSSAPHLPSQVGGSPRPHAGHAARHTQSSFLGREARSKGAEGVLLHVR